jgi:hypothetical protein
LSYGRRRKPTGPEAVEGNEQNLQRLLWLAAGDIVDQENSNE